MTMTMMITTTIIKTKMATTMMKARSYDSEAEESRSGFSNGSSCHQNRSKQYNNWVENDSVKQITVCKPFYEEELLKHWRNDSVSVDIQLIKGVLPDLFAVLKFLESDDNLVYNGIICCYFFKKLQIVKSRYYSGRRETVLQPENQLMEDMLLSAI